MTCKKCKHEFCWVCMGPWSEHGTAWYSCNRYDEKAGVEARDAQSRSRAHLERYLHVRIVLAKFIIDVTLFFAVLQSLGESRTICKTFARFICQDRKKDGRHADYFVFDLD